MTSITTRIRFGLARMLLKSSAFSIVPPWVAESILKPSWASLVRDGYEKNAVFLSCVQALAFAFPEPPLKVYDSDADDAQELANHPLRKLLRRPNALMGEDELWAYTIIYAAIGGNAYWHIERSRGGDPIKLRPFHAGQIKPVPGGPDWVLGYTYDRGDGQLQDIAAEDVVHFKWPTIDTKQPWQAMPPLQGAAVATDTDNTIGRYLFTLLDNDAMPRTVITQAPERYMTPEEISRAKALWRERYGGDHRGDVAILEAGAKIDRLSLGLDELAFDALHKVPEQRICAVMRVPAIIAGLGDDPTYSNAESAYQRWTKSTLVPLWRMWAAEVQSSLGQSFGGDVVTRHDLSRVQALQEDENQRWGRINTGWRSGLLMMNEARASLGFKPVDGGDVFMVGIDLIASDALASFALTAPPAAPQLPAPTVIDAPVSDAPKALLQVAEIKAGEKRAAQTLQRQRRQVAKRMEAAIDAYFTELASTVEGRLEKAWSKAIERKALPAVDELLMATDGEALGQVVGRYYIEILSASWDTWNEILGDEVDFSIDDPAVTEALQVAGEQVKLIDAATRAALQQLLAYGVEQGWTVADLIAGDDERPGIKDLIAETYKGRARTIARTELGTAQNIASLRRYEETGTDRVLVLDNGQDDPDSACKQVNGTLQTVAWARENVLQHPNCTRAFAPHID